MFWGLKDTSSWFCEKPYEKTAYIAEYYNTMSAISYILVGLYIYYLLQMKKIGLSVIYIGIGTILLHGTQRFYGQWADELSMIYFCFSVIQRLNVRIKNFFFVYYLYYLFCVL